MMMAGGRARDLLPPTKREADVLVRRALDVALASAALLCLTPLMLLIAWAIRAESGRPVFFSQIRLGQHGHHFRLYKFRKFHNRESADGTAVTLKHDCRMTRVGRFLAQTKLDEVPQLWNILRGEMSIVGPRPETLAFADCFGETYRHVLNFRPGIFGPNQVFFRNEGSLFQAGSDPEQFYRDVLFPLKARADLAYFPYRSVALDIAWITRGMLAVFGWISVGGDGLDVFDAVESWIQSSGIGDRTRVGGEQS